MLRRLTAIGIAVGAMLSASVRRLRLVFHIRDSETGLTGSMDSIDQGAMGIPLSGVIRNGSNVTFDLHQMAAGFQGVLDSGGRSLAGAWSQGGAKRPLVLTLSAPGSPEVKLIRPQTPLKPYPYREEDVAFDNPVGHDRLAGTLTLPSRPGPYAAAILVAGSGPNTRNEPILGHQLFLVLADHLTRQGVAVLRYDKRGVGASTGDYAKATTADFADDVGSAIAYLKTRPEIDGHRIGLIGHSEGGLIAPMVAAREPSLAYIVLMAGPGVDGADILKEQGRLIARAMGLNGDKAAQASALREKAIDIVRAEKDPDVTERKLRTLFVGQAKAQGLSDGDIDAQIKALNSNWFRFFFNYDPAPTLSRVHCPVLAIAGSKDLQVPPAQNLPAIRAALAANPDVEIDELPGLNHLFQTATTGGVQEYGAIEETLAPVALRTVSRWILKQVRVDARGS
jgi:pimeloyl-ACP methyl ester carboxylesterase